MKKRIMIIICLCIFIFTQKLIASQSEDNLTRIAIATSDAIKYEYRWIGNPPRLIIKFTTPNVFGRLVRNTELNQGVMKSITVNYYPSGIHSSGSRQIKFLTFWLTQEAPYKVWESASKIFIDFQNSNQPASGVKNIEISGTLNPEDIQAKTKAIDTLLASVTSASEIFRPRVAASRTLKPSDIAWLLAVLLTGVYIMWLRPKEWKNFIGSITTDVHNAPSYAGQENRKWWRHNLLPLKDKNIYLKLECPQSNTKLGVIPRNIGYGGLCFECNKTKKLNGKLNLRIFLPGAINPVDAVGEVVWRKNSWNIFRRLIGISFIDPPRKDWAKIHHYIEEQYTSLKS